MTALSIREMNYTLVVREYMADAQMKNLPRHETPVYYWWVQCKTRKSKYNPDGWKVVRDFTGTKAQVADLFVKHYRDGQHRLRCLLKY